MPPTQENSMAAFLSRLMVVIIWIAVVAGVLFSALICMGLVAALNGGEMTIPGGEVYVEDMAPARLVAALAALLVMLPVVVFICIQLRRILSTLAEGDPFVPENAPRLTRIAIAVAAMEIGRNATVIILSAVAGLGEGTDGLRLSVNLAAWASVVAMFVLAQVFREGTRLREEQKMTI